ncbi:MAG: hypothetical protein J6P16_03820 [Eubacterium sp.]|nr:hypothetical protein [Eubacterium sp.]
MNSMIKRILAVAMSFVILSVTPLCDAAPKPDTIVLPKVARAAENDKGGKYIKEVRVGMGATDDEAKKELEAEGFTILKDDSGNNADLNKDAGTGSKLKKGARDKIVYLGYKTTSDEKQAITDLAVMNMNGGYSIEEYNLLMERTMDSEIKPFIDRFISTLEEYRTNHNKPKASLNYKRSEYMRKMLNRLTDDDTGKPMGDLLLEKTKYEMGDSAYNALSDDEKKNHADILTILMQANGQAVLTMETLLTKAADTEDNTWVDRFASTTLEDLEERIQSEKTGLTSQSDVYNELDKKYNDTAKALLEKWKLFNDEVINYEDTADELEATEEDIDKKVEEINKIDTDNSSEEEQNKIIETGKELFGRAYETRTVQICKYLDTVNYDGGTLLDFFSRDYSEVSGSDGIRSLYPIVDALSAGQIAGLEFLSFDDLFSLAMADEDTYKDVQDYMGKADIDSASIYEGVDREVYEKGGVALTSDALREKASSGEKEGYNMSALPAVLWVGTVFSIMASATVLAKYGSVFLGYEKVEIAGERSGELISEISVPKYGWASSFTQKLFIGLSVLVVIMTALSLTMTILDIMDYYNVDFATIPNIMVDAADITAENSKGETILKKHRKTSVYYRAVRCNRTEGSTDIEKKNYEAMEDKADLNGDIGRQWLALYSVRYEDGYPILADSLKYSYQDDKLPSGYETGIHEFGSVSACNLNKKAYLFNSSAPSIYVHYKTEEKTVTELSTAGSMFSTGSVVLGGGVGMVIGALLATLVMRRRRKASL